MAKPKRPCIYWRTNRPNGTLYIGCTSNLQQRNLDYDSGRTPGFVTRYKLNMIIRVEFYSTMEEAIAREKELKDWHRPRKIRLILKDNPTWKDLKQELVFED